MTFRLRLAAATLVMLLAAPGSASARDLDALKAALVYRAATFVEWPEPVTEAGHFVIAVLGADSVASAFEDIAGARTLAGRPLEVRRIESLDQASSCHLLFVGVGASVRAAPMRKTLADRNILTVSDREGFARQGGMIELVRRGGTLKLAIHRGAAERAGLGISLQLLGVAQSVYTDLPDGGT